MDSESRDETARCSRFTKHSTQDCLSAQERKLHTRLALAAQLQLTACMSCFAVGRRASMTSGDVFRPIEDADMNSLGHTKGEKLERLLGLKLAADNFD